MYYLPTLVSIIEVILLIVPVLLTVAFVTVAERKTMASMQRRLGPNIVGYFGVLQAFANALKLLLKEYVSPSQANIILFFIGPIITLIFSLLGYAIIPYAPDLSDGNFLLLIIACLLVIINTYTTSIPSSTKPLHSMLGFNFHNIGVAGVMVTVIVTFNALMLTYLGLRSQTINVSVDSSLDNALEQYVKAYMAHIDIWHGIFNSIITQDANQNTSNTELYRLSAQQITSVIESRESLLVCREQLVQAWTPVSQSSEYESLNAYIEASKLPILVVPTNMLNVLLLNGEELATLFANNVGLQGTHITCHQLSLSVFIDPLPDNVGLQGTHMTCHKLSLSIFDIDPLLPNGIHYRDLMHNIVNHLPVNLYLA